MLVLSRKIGEVITIGNSITITILSFDRGIVRVGIEAPKNIAVHRREVYDKIIEMNKQAVQSDAAALQSAFGSLDLSATVVQSPAAASVDGIDSLVSMRHRKNGAKTMQKDNDA